MHIFSCFLMSCFLFTFCRNVILFLEINNLIKTKCNYKTQANNLFELILSNNCDEQTFPLDLHLFSLTGGKVIVLNKVVSAMNKPFRI